MDVPWCASSYGLSAFSASIVCSHTVTIHRRHILKDLLSPPIRPKGSKQPFATVIPMLWAETAPPVISKDWWRFPNVDFVRAHTIRIWLCECFRTNPLFWFKLSWLGNENTHTYNRAGCRPLSKSSRRWIGFAIVGLAEKRMKWYDTKSWIEPWLWHALANISSQKYESAWRKVKGMRRKTQLFRGLGTSAIKEIKLNPPSELKSFSILKFRFVPARDSSSGMRYARKTNSEKNYLSGFPFHC